MIPDVKENMAKIIEAKMKQLKTQAEKYEKEIKIELRKIFDAENQIKLLNQNNEESKLTILTTHVEQIKQSRITIRNLKKEKNQLLECDIQVSFYDDFNLTSDFTI